MLFVNQMEWEVSHVDVHLVLQEELAIFPWIINQLIHVIQTLAETVDNAHQLVMNIFVYVDQNLQDLIVAQQQFQMIRVNQIHVKMVLNVLSLDIISPVYVLHNLLVQIAQSMLGHQIHVSQIHA